MPIFTSKNEWQDADMLVLHRDNGDAGSFE
ncbi:hypothetical protein SNOG_12304 [Parastagonospora nodorum SN15]|uniref:Uncharacterized protein n=1 Tax=Phaeosphaeria nodorum (strain SN15 / ATCC MYA-4574 / FGSC 10173) TaxID=321614 RepID=Q0U7G0_PHANO|nr:hypothetical protein SNOG_12304 [Parastagonospora nodorum SN15]EAT80117.1 hypothetical protein SNOG_12304 [Parastagonospora nodorum SN15]